MGKISKPKPQTPSPRWLVAVVVSWLACLLASVPVAAQSGPQIVINEIQYHPASDDHGEEYIELHNAGAAAVDLSGWRFSDGIVYTFPPGVSITAGGYVVVGHDPATVEAVYGISGVLGPFESGRLDNGGERVAIGDAGGVLVDEVTYDDHRPWPESPDGKGPSLELISPAFDNDRPCSWGASQPVETSLGTPGAQNSVYSTDNIPPCLTDVAHTPPFPTSSQPVTVTALVDDNSGVAAVTLHYRPEGVSGYVTLAMVDDGSGGDGAAGDSCYTGVIPAWGDGLYVEFYVSATDDEGAERLVPDGAPGTTSGETGLPVTVSYLYQVENTPPTGDLPIYRLITTHENWTELTTRDLFSNVLLDATFVYEGEVFYNVGVRYRGEGSRNSWPRPYRIKFRDEHEFEDRERINLVSDELGREAMAYDLFQRVGLPASDTRFVTLYINENRQGDYLDIEQVDNDFLEAHFPDDDNGNLYRGFDGANLSYRGPAPDSYRPYYLKQNNEDGDDYSDVIALTGALTNSPDETFRAEAETVADVRQWLRWFAVQAVLDNHEGALWVGQGDDYFLYHRPSDGRFILISWDHDGTFSYPDHSIWEPNWLAGEVVRRILNYPDFTRWYYQDIASIAANEFSVAEMDPRVDALPGVVSGEDRDRLKWYVSARIPELSSQIPNTTLSINTNGGADFTTTRPEVTLEGICSPLRDVHVNGGTEGVRYRMATTWRYTGMLWARDNVFVITDSLDSRTITVYWDAFHGGTLTEDTTVATSSYPYAITDNIVVPAGVTLTIEPGVILLFHSNRWLRVEEGGRLLAEGTAAQPIVFTRQGGDYWGGILLERTQADNRISHAIIEYTREVISSPRTHGVSAYGARVTIADSVLRHTDFSVAVQTYPLFGYDPTIYLLRNEIYDIQRDAVHVTGGYAFIQGNHIHDVRHGDYEFEGIEVSHMITPAVLLDNHVHDVSDDCMDLNHSSAVIERNQLHHCGDKGISISDATSTTLVNNLIYGCSGKPEDPYGGTGIAVKDGTVSHIVNNTVSDCRHGIYLYQGSGTGGGTATVVNSIVWGNGSALNLDALSTVTVTYSDVEGGWPGEGNIDDDPLFRVPQGGIYRLLADSPCVDTATPVGAPDVDILGVYRPHGEGYDRGAHEFFEFFSCYLPLTMRSH
jgi:parallel beta-helix repeat protein